MIALAIKLTFKFVTKIKIYFHLSFEKYFKICQLGIVVRLFGLLSLEPGSRMLNKREHGEKLRRETQKHAQFCPQRAVRQEAKS